MSIPKSCLACAVSLISFATHVSLAQKLSGAAVCKAPSRAIDFTTSETSIRELDVSPDGKRLAFDVLGDIYVAPTDGGKAVAITKGNEWDARPVWSPDGTKIAFVSDRNGSDQAFVIEVGKRDSVRVVGSRKHSISVTEEGIIKGLEWAPDGKSLFADRAIIPLDDVSASAFGLSADVLGDRYGNGQDIYEFRRMGGKDRMSVPLEAWRLNGVANEWVRVTKDIPADATSIMISRDGRWLAYKRFTGSSDSAATGWTEGKTREIFADNIFLRDLHMTGSQDRVVYTSGSGSSIRIAGNVAPNDLANRAAFSPDSKFLFTAYDGAVNQIELSTGISVAIPIEVEVDQCLDPIIHFQVPVTEGPLKVRSMRSMTLRPDGKQLAFSALRRIYTVDVPGGKPRVVVPQSDGQFQPSYSPDGRSIAYASWNETTGGHIWRVPANGGISQQLTSIPGYYETPVWSPDGSSIAFTGSRDYRVPRPGFEDAVAFIGSLMVVSSNGGPVRELPVLAQLGHPPSFSSDGKRIRYAPADTAGHKLEVHSISVAGGDTRDEGLRISRMTYQPLARNLPSPDGRMIAVIRYANLYLKYCPVAIGNEEFDQSRCSEKRIARGGPYDVGWRESGAELEWSAANHYYRVKVADVLASDAGQLSTSDVVSERGVPVNEIEVDLQVNRTYAAGSILLAGARVVTMRGDEVIQDGAILIENGRIMKVGRAGEVVVPSGTYVLNLNGKTILPGFIDTHAHLGGLTRDLINRNQPDALVYLAFGVTTAKDPSNGGQHGYANGELVEAGLMVGPRYFGAEAFTNTKTKIESLEDAMALAEHAKALGGTFLKYHSSWNPEQRRWIAEAARANGLNYAAHPPVSNLFDRLNLTTISNGATSGEHEFRFSREHDDVIEYLARSGAWLNLASAASQGKYYRRFWSMVENDPRITNFFEGPVPLKASWSKREEDEHGLPPLLDGTEYVVMTAAEVVKKGGNYTVGSHGDKKGIGFHFEMWAYVRGGMPVHDVLRSASISGAYALGMEKDLGSIEVGKAADILIFDQNPLDDIRNTLSLSRVMHRGFLRDSATLDEVWPEKRPLPEWKVPATSELSK